MQPVLDKPSVFLSYRRSQSKAVGRVRTLLQAAGVDVWLDKTDVGPLDDFPQAIVEGLEHAHAVIVWWSVDYLQSRICAQELQRAHRLAWRKGTDIASHIWILNPGTDGYHVAAGALVRQNFLTPPPDDDHGAELWAAGLAQRLQGLVVAGRLGQSAALERVGPRYCLPDPPEYFVGREALLWQVHTALFPVGLQLANRNLRVQLHGVVSIGKSAFAAHYAHAMSDAFDGGIWWLDMAGLPDEADEERALFELGGQLKRCLERGSAEDGRLLDGLDLESLSGARQLRERVSRHLSKTAGELLWVVDNLPTILDADLRRRIFSILTCPDERGRTLFTARDPKQLLPDACLFAVEDLDKYESARLLRAPRSATTPPEPSEEQALIDLAEQLGGHPLALKLVALAAASYGGPTWSDWLRDTRERGLIPSLRAAHDTLDVVHEADSSTPEVGQLLEQSRARVSEPAKHLFALAGQGRARVALAYDELTEAWKPSQSTLRPAVTELSRFALATVRPRDELVMSELFAQFAREDTARAEQAMLELGEWLVRTLHACETGQLTRRKTERVIGHAEDLAQRAPQRLAISLDVLLAYWWVSAESLGRARRHAERAYEAAFALTPRVGDEMLLQVRACAAKARVLASERHAEQGAAIAISGIELARARGIPSTVWEAFEVHCERVDCLLIQRRFDEAQALLDGLVRDVEIARPDMLQLMRFALSRRMASLHSEMRRDDQVQLWQTRALNAARQHWGEGHAIVLDAERRLQDWSTASEDQPVDRCRVLAMSRKDAGVAHPDTRRLQLELADELIGQNQFDQAQQLYDELLGILDNSPGDAHALGIEKLVVHSRLLRYRLAIDGSPEAPAMLQPWIDDTILWLGPSEHGLMDAIEVLAKTAWGQDHTATMDLLCPLLEHIVSLRSEHQGERHPDTIRAKQNYGSVLASLGNWQRCAEMRMQVATALEQVFGATVEVGYAFFEAIQALRELTEVSTVQDAFCVRAELRSWEDRLKFLVTRINDRALQAPTRH